MTEAVPGALAGWESYYVIVGSSAAALTGLQFVVMALVAEVVERASEDQIDAFGTPSIVHFCVALLTSATLSAPWRSLASAALVLGIVGLAGSSTPRSSSGARAGRRDISRCSRTGCGTPRCPSWRMAR